MWGATYISHFKNAFKKYPPQNRTNVQIKGGGGQRPFEQKLHFFERGASLSGVTLIHRGGRVGLAGGWWLVAPLAAFGHLADQSVNLLVAPG